MMPPAQPDDTPVRTPADLGERIARADPGRLAALLSPNTAELGEWRPEELAEVFEYLWSLPLEPETPDSFPDPANTIRVLLKATDTPPERLQRLRRFAKSHLSKPESSLPRDVALALYYSSMFASVVFHGRSTTRLDITAQRAAATWLSTRPWVDASTQDLARAFLAALDRPQDQHGPPGAPEPVPPH